MKPIPLSKWIANADHPIVIAGPCSAESREQVLATAEQLAKNPLVKVFRAGIWKPRTRPGSFEGVGDIGLPWLKEVKEKHNLMITTEVANTRHVEAALENDIDIIWIGARTSANPFSVQEIANALRGTGKPVLVKNPINADLALWIGALERFSAIGLNKLGAIHRGFSTGDQSKYRNQPKWRIPMELKRRFPSLPIFCDPSHIAGRRDLVPYVIQRAMDIHMDGLMVETHIDPTVALSDAAQQVTPESLNEILSSTVYRQERSADTEFEQALEDMRGQIDRADQEILDALLNRMKVVEKIGNAKAHQGVTPLQVGRFDAMINKRADEAKKIGLDTDFATEIYNVIHDFSVRYQTQIMNEFQKKQDS